jgi:2-C-methyl-D-erythritol 2,4-cyclodiphosphate synthase
VRRRRQACHQTYHQQPPCKRMPRDSDASVRVGVGYDSHRFAHGRPLKLGGVVIPSDVGLAGHSDADAVCHAITDAILGAAGLGDIGEMFPDTDEANRNRDSIEMLEAAVQRVAGAGMRVNHVDVSVVAETPRLGPHCAKIREKLAAALSIDTASVSVKGKSNEGMGWIGRKEGIACIAVATLTKTS